MAWGLVNGSLPVSWGRPGAFPVLKELRLEGQRFTGALPTEWAAPGAFPALEIL